MNLLNALNVPDFENFYPPEIANGIDEALLEPLRQFQPLNREPGVYPLPLEDNPVFLEATPERVYGNLLHLNKHKAPGPDGLSNWFLKEYAELLYQPIADILKSSYKEQKARGRYSTPESKTSGRSEERTQTDFANRIAFQGCGGLRSIRLHKNSLREDSRFKLVWHRIRFIHCPRSVKYDVRVAPSNRRK